MTACPTVGIDDDLPPGQSGVTLGATHDKTPGGIDVLDHVRAVETRFTQHRSDDKLRNSLANLLILDIARVLSGKYDCFYRFWLSVNIFNGNLTLSVWPQPRNFPGSSQDRQPLRQAMSNHDRQWHQFRCLVGGITEHHSLIASTAGVDALGYVRRLSSESRHHSTGLAVKPHARIRIADILHYRAHDFRHIDVRIRGNLTREYDQAGCKQRLARDSGGRIVSENGVQNTIRYLVSHLVGMALGNRFRREYVLLRTHKKAPEF